ncbi:MULTISPECIES: hypothetical protein [unclassified Arsukibacterium]|uniref:hypothetical protein n=1 Tax=unclassified Arsukibacterium TaxID=2635278 RepID=UPI000C64359C|nr:MULTISPECIES: hypothetical protein [unclassified Arsukibacterium]MAA92907.1 hypothetical protein [Rheinheimera sp.]MBM34972.1 hypothetical protein [Rheinheimera sp.]HAW93276.1 hypothetical protein [Candidatus Azambacteria bacterium]|tara:strand:- start:3356 stop:4444 length:1089 start_codon:yes stop_codon:yes gene_type:complete
MYNLSSAAHAVLQQLKKQNTSVPTRAQILELLAAYFDYKTYASFKADGSINQEKLKAAIADGALAHARLLNRLSELRLPASLVDLLKQSFIQQFQSAKLEPKVSLLRIAQHLGIAPGRIRLTAKEAKASYAHLLTNQEADSVLLRYVWQRMELDASLDDDDTGTASKYWYEQRQSGAQLSTATLEWANQYERYLIVQEREQNLITQFSNKKLARPNFTDVVQGKCEPNICWYVDALYLLHLLGESMLEQITDDSILDWGYLASLQQPNHESLVESVYGLDDDVEVWAWYLFGLSQKIDITASNYRLINSYTGEEWDEYGPAEPVGYHGINLPAISDSQKHEAKLIADRMQSLMNLVKQPAQK